MSADMTRFYTPDPEIGLFGGRWVPNGRGGVRWSQEREPSPMPASEPAPPPFRAAKEDLCGTCGTVFTRSRENLRFCSEECRAEGVKARQRRHKRKPSHCADCNKLIDRKAKRCKRCSTVHLASVRGARNRKDEVAAA